MSTTSSISPLTSLIKDMRDESIGLRSLMSPSLAGLSPLVRLSDSDNEPTNDHKEPTIMTTDHVSWGIHWKQPALIVTFALCGLAGAIGHHLYYHFMDNTVVSSSETQQRPLRFGTAFSFFTITMLQATVVAAYNQYIWKAFRDNSFSVADLDKIFSLTSDFTGFLSLALFKCGRLVILLASLCWLLPLAGLTPPATLSVVTSLQNETIDHSLPTLDFTSPYWQAFVELDVLDLTKLALITSEEMVMPQLSAPAPNSSYVLQFYGPTILCSDASSSEQVAFDQYSMALWNESQIFTSLTFQMFNDGELGFPKNSNITLDSYSVSFLVISVFYPHPRTGRFEQFWVQTANSSIVCSAANASFEVDIKYLNGVQSISQRNIETTNLVNYSMSETKSGSNAYEYILDTALVSDTLFGTVSITGFGYDSSKGNFYDTGLITCEEIFWWLNLDRYNGTSYDPTFFAEAMGIPAEYSLCRNRSISLAIQDLANNVTMSLLSNPNMTVNVSTPVSITTPRNIYHYDSPNLVISYVIGIAAAIFAVIVSLMAIHSNGVCHSTSFSAIVTSTIGNCQLGELSKGQSLGAEPLSRTLAEKKLRLGIIKGTVDEAEKDEWGIPIGRIGFGLEGTVTKLRKGETCL